MGSPCSCRNGRSEPVPPFRRTLRYHLSDVNGHPEPTGSIEQALAHAGRLLQRSPGFALTVIATLALCIGANTAIFSVVDAVLFRPLPYPQPERLAQVFIYYSDAQHQGEYWGTSQNGATWEMLRDGGMPVRWAAFSGSARLIG